MRPHPLFMREGSDIHVEVSVPLVDAILGADIKCARTRPSWLLVKQTAAHVRRAVSSAIGWRLRPRA